MSEPGEDRYSVRADGDYYYVYDNLANKRLPYESRNRTFGEGVVRRLLDDYRTYLHSCQKTD